MTHLTPIEENSIRALLSGMTIHAVLEVIEILEGIVWNQMTNPVPSPDTGESSINGELSGFDIKSPSSLTATLRDEHTGRG